MFGCQYLCLQNICITIVFQKFTNSLLIEKSFTYYLKSNCIEFFQFIRLTKSSLPT